MASPRPWMKSLSRLCFLTPADKDAASTEAILLAALEAGVRWVQFRRKAASRRELYTEALRLKELAARFDAFFTINDHADIALAVDADGLHIGQDDLPLMETRRLMGPKLIGVSTHSISEALDATEGGAHYIGFGPIFRTNTKDAGRPKGCGALSEVASAVTVPVIAIGGITHLNAADVLRAGCDGIAVSAGISSGDVRNNVASFLDVLKTCKGGPFFSIAD
jgi:thiamine-phosphate pyrophosphorylase